MASKSFINDIEATVAEQTRVIEVLRDMTPNELLQQLRTSTAKAEASYIPASFDEQREAAFYKMLTEREIIRRMES